MATEFAQAVAQMEGYNTPGTPAQRNNNPGNLRSWGSNPVAGGFAVFSTPEEGWAALETQIQKNIDRGLTLQEFFGGKPGVYDGYAPAADSNRPLAYANFVADRLDIPVDVPIAQALDSGGFFPSGSDDAGTSNLMMIAVVGIAAIGVMLFLER